MRLNCYMIVVVDDLVLHSWCARVLCGISYIGGLCMVHSASPYLCIQFEVYLKCCFAPLSMLDLPASRLDLNVTLASLSHPLPEFFPPSDNINEALSFTVV